MSLDMLTVWIAETIYMVYKSQLRLTHKEPVYMPTSLLGNNMQAASNQPRWGYLCAEISKHCRESMWSLQWSQEHAVSGFCPWRDTCGWCSCREWHVFMSFTMSTEISLLISMSSGLNFVKLYFPRKLSARFSLY